MTAAAHSREPPAGDSCCAINLSAGARLPGAGSDAFLIRNLLAVGQRATPPGQPVDLRTGGRRPGEPSAHQPAGAQEPGAAHNNNNNNKQRRSRTMFTEWQLAALEWRFARNKYLTTSDRIRIAKLLQLDQLQVKTWFQVSSWLAGWAGRWLGRAPVAPSRGTAAARQDKLSWWRRRAAGPPRSMAPLSEPVAMRADR